MGAALWSTGKDCEWALLPGFVHIAYLGQFSVNAFSLQPRPPFPFLFSFSPSPRPTHHQRGSTGRHPKSRNLSVPTAADAGYSRQKGNPPGLANTKPQATMAHVTKL